MVAEPISHHNSEIGRTNKLALHCLLNGFWNFNHPQLSTLWETLFREVVFCYLLTTEKTKSRTSTQDVVPVRAQQAEHIIHDLEPVLCRRDVLVKLPHNT